MVKSGIKIFARLKPTKKAIGVNCHKVLEAIQMCAVGSCWMLEKLNREFLLSP